MQPLDVVCRAAAYPKFGNEVFDKEQFFNFSSEDSGKTYACSVVSRHLIRTESGVHAYGERYAAAVNERFEREKGFAPPDDKRCRYLAYYTLCYCDIMEVRLDYYRTRVAWRPERDCDAHFQIEFLINGISATKGQRRNDRKAAVSFLFQKSKGPILSPEASGDPERSALLRLLIESC